MTSTGVIGFSDLDLSILATFMGDGDAFSIRFDHKGPAYVGTRVGTTFSIGRQPPGTSDGLPFEVTLPPTRSVVAPLTLPADSVVDLFWSGIGTAGNEFALAVGVRPVIVTFSPIGLGGVRVLLHSQPPTFSSFRPIGPLHLLIGRRNRVIDPTDPNLAERIVNP